ncbi:hypothetical protein F5X71_16325 [Nocardia brasiliensis]|uniref:Nitroreductase domain-containing protein n=1 Tax=Nocardia brasiliensis TaxID=37326 RepID=A0A6G9XRZ2_NOCBR|nr:hypothetical protein [Nocardia brasiliensis]QIS03678.1 hypothetical protein F5X71_16325 [Nocardia brasiliensis]
MTAPDRAAAPSPSIVRAALALACRAPSVRNTQPWHWVFDGSTLLLYRDTERQLPAIDPQHRQATIGCGAALDHARQAFVSMDWFAHITRIPRPGFPELLAAVEFRLWCGPLNRTAARVRAITRRHSDRLPMLPPEDWPDVLATARELARPHQVSVTEITDDTRPRVADAIYTTRKAALEDRSRLLVLGTAGDSRGQWLHTGEALSNILLECTARGLATCELTQVTEPASTRSLLTERLPLPGVAQVVVRVGTAVEDTAITMSPRRPLSEVLEFQDAASNVSSTSDI